MEEPQRGIRALYTASTVTVYQAYSPEIGQRAARADEEVVEVFFTDTELRRIHHPYDGGADVILATPEERDRLRGQYTDWLSSHPTGL